MVSPASFPKQFLHLDSTEATLEKVGGKGANLARLARAGFNVPNGFLIPIDSYKEFVEENGLDTIIRAALDNLDFNDPSALQEASQRIRSQFGLGSVSRALDAALRIAYGWIGAPPVAVRSSATAEDLPDMSFAGQQDTFLNIIGADELSNAVISCWSSLWTARAIGYRARNEIPQEDVSLSVVVQEMVEADVSGVMFTSNPLSGKRDEIVIDATFGLGEALVSGQVEPDNYIIQTALHSKSALQSAFADAPRSATHPKADAMHFSIKSKTLGAKATVIRGNAKGGITITNVDQAKIQACPDKVILQLAEIGQKIQEEYDFPQDVEWAYYKDNLYILQSRPITSLYPLPPNLASSPLRAMIGLHVMQGVIEPYSPLGMQTLENVLSGAALAFGADYSYKNQTAFHEAGERIWIDVTSIIKHPLGHKAYPTAIKSIDPAVGQIFENLLNDPQFSPSHQPPKLRTIINLLKFIIPFWGRIFRYWYKPEDGAALFRNLTNAKIAKTQARSKTSGDLWENFREHIAIWGESRFVFSDMVVPHGVSAVVAGMVPFFGILQRFSKEVGEPQLYLEISRGLPNNVTTEMDLFLWKTAQDIAADTESQLAFAESPAFQLATDYQQDALPSIAQQSLAQFMSRYGMRGLGEIDMGRIRWREEPLHIIQTLQSYLKITDPDLAPDVVFARGTKAAELAGKRLETKVRQLKSGKLKSRLVRWAISRYRPLAGLREAPKFFAIQMLGIIREGILESGKSLVAENLLEKEDDLFFLKIEDLEEIAKKESISEEMLEKISEKRALRAREMRRKMLPRVLLSDGRAFFEGLRDINNENGIFGDPVSPGMVEGRVRVVLNPHATQLQVGEILVCTGTDPAWTPLFLAAGGLVMEVGGLMTHGSVVAREYGIPAVVGVHEATTRLKTGMIIRVDGSSGVIEIMEEK
ncbi:MAG: hypothetical protein HN855_04285 [Anaerolineae bacterium]|jgi:rifampicin phosphotransferase|nr:hypothetical protein [Anaerolineae bacterium]MBT7070850.1 hypothetical protein [Anaerolineae bacterium]MBT7324354.1 hypothetical protein [Anaerolineae bacterium]